MIQPGERKVRLIYLLPRYDAESPEHVFHLYGFLRKLQKRIPVQILVERLTGKMPEDLPARALRLQFPLLRFLEELIRFLAARSQGVRIFYVHYSYTGAIAASLVTRLLGGETYYWNCSMYGLFRPAGNAGWREQIRFLWNTFLLETTIRMCSHLVTGTPRMAAYYADQVKVKPETIRLLPNFVDITRFDTISKAEARARLGLDPSRKIVLFLHRVAPRKGAHYLPEILRALAREMDGLTLLVAGDGPLLPDIKRQIHLSGLSSCVDYRHWVPNAEVPMYYRSADLFIMPSVEEGFPRVLLEAMAAACPFVAFDVGGVRDVVAEEQFECLVPWLDLGSFIPLCVTALQNPKLRLDWVSIGERQVRKFTEERVLNAFVKMIDGWILDWPAFLASDSQEER